MYRAIFHLNTNTPITYSSEPLGLDALAKATSRRLCAIFRGINKGKAKGSQHVRRRVAQGVCLEAANCSRRYSKGHQILEGGGAKGACNASRGAEEEEGGRRACGVGTA